MVAFSGTWRLSGNAQPVFRTLLRARRGTGPDGRRNDRLDDRRDDPEPLALRDQALCQLHGSRDEFNSILGDALTAADNAEAQDCSFSDCSSKALLELPYWDAQEFFAVWSLPNRYQETSLFAREVTDHVIDELFRMWRTWPGTVSAARMTAYRTGGKVNTVPPDAMAFVHRSSRWMVTTDIDWSGSDSQQHIRDNLQWQRAVHNALYEMLGRPGSYYNFPDPELANHARAYWGSNLAQLVHVKLQVDPHLVFTPPRNQWIVH